MVKPFKDYQGVLISTQRKFFEIAGNQNIVTRNGSIKKEEEVFYRDVPDQGF
ncbi:MAG: hypothetical protein GY786_11515 [Proteobacteria bacterium]|nr:hypothetical protein [Pseudomonadota bacterium]